MFPRSHLRFASHWRYQLELVRSRMVIAVALVPGHFGPLLLKPCEEIPSIPSQSWLAIAIWPYASAVAVALDSFWGAASQNPLCRRFQLEPKLTKAAKLRGSVGVPRLDVREHVSVKTRNSQNEMVTVYWVQGPCSSCGFNWFCREVAVFAVCGVTCRVACSFVCVIMLARIFMHLFFVSLVFGPGNFIKYCRWNRFPGNRWLWSKDTHLRWYHVPSVEPSECLDVLMLDGRCDSSSSAADLGHRLQGSRSSLDIWYHPDSALWLFTVFVIICSDYFNDYKLLYP